MLGAGLAACQFSPPPDIDSIDAAVDAPGQVQLTLTVGHADGSAGTVTVEPGGATCSTGTCNVLVEEGATVTVTAMPATPQDRVVAVSGDCGAVPCSLTMTGPRTVNVDFQRFVCGPPSSQRCEQGRYSQCDATGAFVSYDVPNGAPDGTAATLTMNGYLCPLGCSADGTRCNDVDASNGLNAAMDTADVSPAGLDLALPRSSSIGAGTIVINTDVFNTITREAEITDADGVLLHVPAEVFSQVDAPEILVLKVRSFTISPGRVVEVRGARALAVASHFDVVIGGRLDLAGRAGTLDGASVPSGRSGSGHALRSSCEGGSDGSGRFGGGGNFTAGSAGTGAGAQGGMAILGGTLSPLEGGCGGGWQENGGGAVQFATRTRLLMKGNSLINLSGGGGNSFDAFGFFGTGGGAGGSVLIEAPSAVMQVGAVIAGRGGSGGASNTTSVVAMGLDGTVSGAGAASITCAGCGTSGSGGTELGPPSAATTSGQAGTGTPTAAGGGSVGKAVIRNALGAFSPPAGGMKIRLAATVALGVR